MSEEANTIRKALLNLGYRKGGKVRVYYKALNRSEVFVDNSRIGIFDFARNAFVD
uniref:Uncharacterized protein n=1 Tax=uncultured prokaryote TaxID=198431 RepID=A0A0H5Q729_9ZZZZ|nr:hypothetical protein [uncultured prokaryote]